MAEVGSAFVSVVPSARGFGKKLDGQVGPELDKSGKAGSKRFGSSFGSGLKSAIGPALAVVGAAAVGGLLKGAVNEASNLSETLNKSSVIFGKSAAGIERFGNSAAKSLGLSKNEAIAAAAGFGDMFSQIGFTQAAAAKMSKSTIQLAADLGSFNNLETADVTDRLSAAFRGEYDSLQAVIPNINAARVESEALAKTGKKTAKELTAQEKAAAVLAIVHKDGARATGDFARTSGGLANQQKILSAQTADLKAKIGAALLPAFTKTASYLNKTAVPAFSKFVSEMESGEGTGGKVAAVLKDLGSGAKTVATAVLSVINAFRGMPGAAQKALLLGAAALVISNQFNSRALPAIQNFDRAAAAATAKSVALKGGLLAAGVGLAALSANASNAKVKLAAATASAAAMGFAVAGPLGAAVGAGSVLISTFANRNDAAATSANRFRAGVAGATATLNQQTGALTAATRASVAKALADGGAFTAARKVGASYRDVLSAALGNEAAHKRVTAATNSYIKANSGSFHSTLKAAKVAGTLTNAVGTTSKAIDNERRKLDQVNSAMGKLDGKKATITIRGVGIGAAIGGLAGLNRQINSTIARAAKLSRVRIGANAKGTDSWRGGLTWVGEEGPELINLAKGAQVIPNHKIGDVGAGAGRPATVGQAGSGGSITLADLRALLAQGVRITGTPNNLRLQMAGA